MASELAYTYTCLAHHDDGIAIVTAEKIANLVKAANISVESYWQVCLPSLLRRKILRISS
ncbi:unnamed protein product [Rhodiola kirilowii]